QGQPTQPQPPAVQGQPAQPQPPAAQGQPAQPQPPAAQGQPGQQQPPAGQAQTPPAVNQPATATAPPPAQQATRPAMTDRGAIAPQPTGAQGQPLRRVDDLRNERREVREGDRLVIREPDRVIIREGNQTIIRHNETNRFLMGGREVGVDRRGTETTTIVERPDGTRIITITDDDGRLIRRVRRAPDGREVIIIDSRDTRQSGTTYYVDLPPPVVRIPRERYIVEAERASPEIIYETLMAAPVERIDRRYTLEQVRYSQPLRERMSRIDVDTINFESGSWEIAPDQVNRLAVIANAMSRAVMRNPAEVFLIEGHTDAVGADVDNLSLSDRRAESAALALTERFHIPPENLTTQGYGEQYLKVQTEAAERQNRRVTVRRITPLLTGDNQSTGQVR
ncbi:MAG: OmpA family protein, partial [Xanthobacteraceae bacterium]